MRIKFTVDGLQKAITLTAVDARELQMLNRLHRHFDAEKVESVWPIVSRTELVLQLPGVLDD